MVSALTQKYDWSHKLAFPPSSCVLIVDGQIYYQDNMYRRSDLPRSKWRTAQYPNEKYFPPEEIKLLIDYIIDLSNLSRDYVFGTERVPCHNCETR